jgi:predicted transcriptional regulator of viral defense system
MKYKELIYRLSVFSTEDIRDNFPSAEAMQFTLTKYIRQNLIVRIKRGLYAAVDPSTGGIYANRYEIATKGATGAYIAFHSALEYHGVANQVFNTVYVCGDARFRTFEYDGLEYVRIMPPSVEIGVTETERNSVIRVTGLERTIVDCVNELDLAGGLEEVAEAITACPYLNEERLKEYLKGYDKKVLYQKVGYLMSTLKRNEFSAEFFAFCKTNMGKGNSYMTENINARGKLNREWRLIVPEELENIGERANG